MDGSFVRAAGGDVMYIALLVAVATVLIFCRKVIKAAELLVSINQQLFDLQAEAFPLYTWAREKPSYVSKTKEIEKLHEYFLLSNKIHAQLQEIDTGGLRLFFPKSVDIIENIVSDMGLAMMSINDSIVNRRSRLIAGMS